MTQSLKINKDSLYQPDDQTSHVASPIKTAPKEDSLLSDNQKAYLAALLVASPVVAAPLFSLSSLAAKPVISQVSSHRSVSKQDSQDSLWDGVCHYASVQYEDFKNSLDSDSKQALEEIEDSLGALANVVSTAFKGIYDSAVAVYQNVISQNQKELAQNQAKEVQKNNPESSEDVNADAEPLHQAAVSGAVVSGGGSIVHPDFDDRVVPVAVHTVSLPQNEESKASDALITNQVAVLPGQQGAKSLLMDGPSHHFQPALVMSEGAVSVGSSLVPIGLDHDVVSPKAEIINSVLVEGVAEVDLVSAQAISRAFVSHSAGAKLPVSGTDNAVLPVQVADAELSGKVAVPQDSDHHALALVLDTVGETLNTYVAQSQVALTDLSHRLSSQGMITAQQISDLTAIRELAVGVMMAGDRFVPFVAGTQDYKNNRTEKGNAIFEDNDQRGIVAGLAKVLINVHGKGGSNAGDSSQEGRDSLLEELIASSKPEKKAPLQTKQGENFSDPSIGDLPTVDTYLA